VRNCSMEGIDESLVYVLPRPPANRETPGPTMGRSQAILDDTPEAQRSAIATRRRRQREFRPYGIDGESPAGATGRLNT